MSQTARGELLAASRTMTAAISAALKASSFHAISLNEPVRPLDSPPPRTFLIAVAAPITQSAVQLRCGRTLQDALDLGERAHTSWQASVCSGVWIGVAMVGSVELVGSVALVDEVIGLGQVWWGVSVWVNNDGMVADVHRDIVEIGACYLASKSFFDCQGCSSNSALRAHCPLLPPPRPPPRPRPHHSPVMETRATQEQVPLRMQSALPRDSYCCALPLRSMRKLGAAVAER